MGIRFESGSSKKIFTSGLLKHGDISFFKGDEDEKLLMVNGEAEILSYECEHDLYLSYNNEYFESISVEHENGNEIGSGSSKFYEDETVYLKFTLKDGWGIKDVYFETLNASVDWVSGEESGPFEYCFVMPDSDNTVLFNITKLLSHSDIKATLTGVDNLIYSGSDLKDAILGGLTVKDDGYELSSGSHYTVSFEKGGKAVNEVKGAGTYSVIIAGKMNEDYGGSLSLPVTVKKCPVAVTASGKDTEFVYDGKGHMASFSVKADKALYNCGSSVRYAGDQSYTEAGTYNVHFDAVDFSNSDENFAVTFSTGGECTLTIFKREISLKACDQSVPVEGSIDKTPASVSMNGGTLADGQSLSSVSVDCAVATDKVGEYENAITVSGAMICRESEDMTANYDISYAPGKLTVTMGSSKVITAPKAAVGLVCDGGPHELVTRGEAGNGKMMYRLGEGDWSETIPTATEAGIYYVWYKVSGDGNHNDTVIAGPVDAEISKAVAKSFENIAFEQDRKLASVSASVAGLMPEDAGELKYTAGEAVLKRVDGSTTKVSDFTVDASGKISASLTDGTAGDVITLPVVIGSENYEDSAVNVVVTLTEEKEPDVPPVPLVPPVKSYTVSFNMCGHGSAIESQKVEEGKTVVRPEDPKDEAYEFEGWYTAENYIEAYDFAAPVNKDMELFAKWTLKISPMNPVPVIDDETTEIHLVKGQKFTLPEGEWKSSNKKFVSIAKKTGLLTAKKETTDGTVTITKTGSDKAIMVYITVPKLEKKKTMNAGAEAEALKFEYDKDNLRVQWSSANPDVATVSENGLVTPVAKGKAVITAYINGKAYTSTVTVKETTPVELRTLHLNIGAGKSVKVKGVKSWNVSDNSIVSVKKLKVKGLKAGTTVLTGTDKNGKAFTVAVTVEDIGIKTGKIVAAGKNKYKVELKAGEKVRLEFNDVKQEVTFKSSNGDKAYADKELNIVANHEGKATLTAKINGKTVTLKVVIREAPSSEARY